MPKKHYSWKDGTPQIKQHSQAKHRVLKKYLIQYLQTLACFPGQTECKLTLVDGFAGGGVYIDSASGCEQPGSPFIMLDAVREASEEINKDRTNKISFDVHYVFVEKLRDNYLSLLNELNKKGYSDLIGESIFVLNSPFENETEKIIALVKNHTPKAERAIFLLDQYGYSDVHMDTINSIFRYLKNSEIILTFHVSAFLTYMDKDNVNGYQPLSKIGIALPEVKNPDLSSMMINDDELLRYRIQSSVQYGLMQSCNAGFYTPFFINGTKGYGEYWLIHMSQHLRARMVMLGVHWDNSNDFKHYAGPGLDMFNIIGYSQKKTNRLDFGFDDLAEQESKALLVEQLPRIFYSSPEGVTFQALLEKHCNLSPAKEEIFREALNDLIAYKEIAIISKDGVTRRKGNNVHLSDYIKPPAQRVFIFPT